jgi:L-arabinokinase
MGGIADYSGSLVLELPIAESTLVALQRTDERVVRIVSVEPVAGPILEFSMPLADFDQAGTSMSYEGAREYFKSQPQSHWAAYVAGAFLVLMRERHINFPAGVRIFISSTVPLGKGVSSSAALEVAAMQAIASAFDISIEPRELALLCQKVENLVAGAPCGAMDQMSVVCGEANRLLALVCQPAELCGTIPVPENVAFWGIDSGVRHSIAGADYGSVRVGAFIGYRIIADLAGLKSQDEKGIRIDDPKWRGYLSNITPSEFEELYAPQVPEAINGADFLAQYKGTTDPVTEVCPERTYQVRVPAAHAIYEHDRVRRFAELLKQVQTESTLALLGELMYQSHASYSACGLGSDGTDRLVELVREASPAAGLYGAKITGGGSGGTVAVLGTRSARSSLDEVAGQYARETGYQPYIFEGSSPGSAAFGYLKLTPS